MLVKREWKKRKMRMKSDNLEEAIRRERAMS